MVLGYSDFLKSLSEDLALKNGLIVDTNVLISATYDSDRFFEETTEFLNFVVEQEVPHYCNVNVRAEFLEIHRRIIFSEMLFDFSELVDAAKLGWRLLPITNPILSSGKKILTINK